MKKKRLKLLKKYTFEILVIFVGITLSFMFDEWRSNRQEKVNQRQLFETISIQLSQTKITLLQEDSILQSHSIILVNLIQQKEIPDSVMLNMFAYLNRDYYLNLVGLLNTLKSLSEQGASVISKNLTINQRISFINSITIDHANLNEELRTLSNDKLRSHLLNYGITDDLFYYEYTSQTDLKGRYEVLKSDPDFQALLKIFFIKIDGLSTIYDTLNKYLQEIDSELEIMINSL